MCSLVSRPSRVSDFVVCYLFHKQSLVWNITVWTSLFSFGLGESLDHNHSGCSRPRKNVLRLYDPDEAFKSFDFQIANDALAERIINLLRETLPLWQLQQPSGWGFLS